MKKMFSTLLFLSLILSSVSFAENYIPTYNANFLVYDKGLQPIQGFAPDPAKAQVPASINAAATSSLTVTGWTAVMFAPSGDVQVYFNTDSTKYMTFAGNTRHVFIIRPDVTTVVFKNAGSSAITVSIWGM